MLLKVGPIPFERVGTKAGFLEVSLHGACEDSMRVSGIKGILNGGRVCSSGERGVALFVPILNDHRNRGGPAPILLLAHEGNVKPYTRCCRAERRYTQCQRRDFVKRLKHQSERSRFENDDNDHRRRQRDDDIRDLLVRESSGCKVALRLVSLRSEASQFFVAQAWYRLLHLFVRQMG